MKYLDILKNYEKYLINKKKISPTSANIYKCQIRELINLHGIDPKIDEINRFIKNKYKDNKVITSPSVKYYLDFRWRNGLICKIQFSKDKKKKCRKKFLSKKQALDFIIIHKIINKKHQISISYYIN